MSTSLKSLKQSYSDIISNFTSSAIYTLHPDSKITCFDCGNIITPTISINHYGITHYCPWCSTKIN